MLDANLGIWRAVLNPAPRRILPRPGLFLDRDGTIVREIGYLHRPEEAELVEGAALVFRAAKISNFAIAVITNQSGIGRGKFGWDEFAATESKILKLLKAEGAFIDGLYACPYHAEGVPPYQHPNHPMRKPNPGMLELAAEDLKIDLSRSWFIGDRANDLAALKAAGGKNGILVETGYGAEAAEIEGAKALADGSFNVFFAKTIKDALQIIPDLLDALEMLEMPEPDFSEFPDHDHELDVLTETGVVIDLQHISDFFGDDLASAYEMLRDFHLSNLTTSLELSTAISERDKEGVKMLGHRLKGSSLSVGIRETGELGAQFEDSVGDGPPDWPAIELMYVRLVGALERAGKAIDSLSQKQAA